MAGTRRGGSRRSRSTVMCPCRRGMCSTPACFTVCGVTVRFDGCAASGAGTVGAGSARWSASTSGRPRPTPGRWPATLPWPKIPKQPAKNLERSPYWLPRNRIVAWATLRLAQRACRRSTRLGCAGRRNCNVNLDDLRWDRPDQDCEPQQAPGIPRNLQLDETVVMVVVWGVLVPSQTDLNQAEGGRECHFERFMQAA